MSPFAATMATADAHENTPMLLGKGTVTLPPAAESCDSECATDDVSTLGTTVWDSGRSLRASLDLSRAALLLLTMVAAYHTVWRPFSSPADAPSLGAPSRAAGPDWSALDAGSGAVLVTGATGRTGALLYRDLQRRGVADVRAFVRDADKARTVLGCDACDEAEGIFVGDLTEPAAVASGAGGRSAPATQRAVEFDAVVAAVAALEAANPGRADALRVVLCSSMGTTRATPPSWGGDILHWKLNAEAFLSSSAVASTVIVKPCGLLDAAGGNATLVVGHHDELFDASPHYTVSRADVAAVMAEAATMAHEVGKSDALRFDLCSVPGPATTDLAGLIDDARWGWDR